MSYDYGGATFSFGKAQVCALDANPLFLDLTCGVLQGFGFRRLQRCTELEAAIAHVKSRPIDLLLIDPYPWGQDAFAFIRALRANEFLVNAGVPVLIVTGHTRLGLVAEMRQCGADYIIAKPFSMGGLLDRILFVAHQEGRRTAILEPQAREGRVFGAQPW